MNSCTNARFELIECYFSIFIVITTLHYFLEAPSVIFCDSIYF